MNKYEGISKKLNEFPVLSDFHDMSIINMEFKENNIIIRFSLFEYLDKLGILEDEDHVAIVEVKYTNISDLKINMYGIINFRDLDVMYIADVNNIIELNAYNYEYDCYFDLSFDYEKYNWKIIDIITTDEFYAYREKISENNDYLYDINTYDGPNWSKI